MRAILRPNGPPRISLMTIRVYKAGEVVGNVVHLLENRSSRSGDLFSILTKLNATDDPLPESAWRVDLVIGDGPAARNVRIGVPPLLPKRYQRDEPFFIGAGEATSDHRACHVIYFRDRLFVSERLASTPLEREEITPGKEDCLRGGNGTVEPAGGREQHGGRDSIPEIKIEAGSDSRGCKAPGVGQRPRSVRALRL